MPLTARRHVRKMRGGAQAHLLEASDGRFYVVKARNNPQHHRVLTNESVASVLLRYLEIPAPEIRIISVAEDFLRGNPEMCIQLGSRRVPVEAGWHFGSCYPGHPDRVAVYDFVPDALLGSVLNLADFTGALVFDKWVANADGRQAVFFRSVVSEWSPQRTRAHDAFVAYMIDHGFAFNGPHWEFADSPLQGLYHRPVVYEGVRSLDDFQPWLDRVVHFPAEVLDQALRSVPLQWIEGEEDALEGLLEQLYRRRARVPGLLEAVRNTRPALFPNWC
jgi:hypothetical protein